MVARLLFSIFFLFITNSIYAACPDGIYNGTCFYVRTDGGSRTQCDGKTNAAYPGSGTGQPCAVDSIFEIFPPAGTTPNLGFASGDSLIIADGTYQYGLNSPNATQNGGTCYAGAAYNCFMMPPPSGISTTAPTRIYGEHWKDGCATKPLIVGNNRIDQVLNLGWNTSNFDIQCLEITDGEDCIEAPGHTDNSCATTPYDTVTMARVGLFAGKVSNVNIRNVSIHGMAQQGVNASGTNWTMRNLVLLGNKVGWDGDTGTYPTSTGDEGVMDFGNVHIEYSGCAEDYPIVGSPVYRNCITGNAYSDGFGTDPTNATYVFENCNVSHNNHDGIDMLYGNTTTSLYVKNCLLENNSGNQLKIKTGHAYIEGNTIIGNCCYMAQTPPLTNTCTTNCPGETTTECRANGDVIFAKFLAGSQYYFYNNTVTSEANVLLSTEEDGAGTCIGTEQLTWVNNIAVGSRQCVAAQSSDTSDFYYSNSPSSLCSETTVNSTFSNNIVHQTKDDVGAACPTGATCGDPLFNGITWSSEEIVFNNPGSVYASGDIYLSASSNARDAADETITCVGDCSKDMNLYSRGASWDIGSLEYGSSIGYSCYNGIRDGFEEGQDCGGYCAIACPVVRGSYLYNITPTGSIKFQ